MMMYSCPYIPKSKSHGAPENAKGGDRLRDLPEEASGTWKDKRSLKRRT